MTHETPYSFQSNQASFTLNIWDVGGQKTLRSYWRNYYEQTDGLIWVVDSSDIRRLEDCKKELHKLLQEEKLAGSSLLIFANKQDIHGALSKEDIQKISASIAYHQAVRSACGQLLESGYPYDCLSNPSVVCGRHCKTGSGAGLYEHKQALANLRLQCGHRGRAAGR
eukprot:6937804-Pyramimonas_sp.AAC.1